MNAQNLAKKKPQKIVVPDFYQFAEKNDFFSENFWPNVSLRRGSWPQTKMITILVNNEKIGKMDFTIGFVVFSRSEKPIHIPRKTLSEPF